MEAAPCSEVPSSDHDKVDAPARVGGGNVRALTITELERETGVPRSTVYFYVREGYLPPAQKAAASRGIYTEAHVELLREIIRLKEQGLPLEQIREHVESQLNAALENEVDLVARQMERNRRAIIEAAARHFARRGYKRTRISDIIGDVGVSPPAFYAQFRSKRQLFLESFSVFLEWMKEFIEPQIAEEPDPAIRFLYRMAGHFGLQALSPDLFALTRAEALHEGDDMRAVAVHTMQSMTQEIHQYLHVLREASPHPPSASDELFAYSLLGALETTVQRAAWDDTFSRRDTMWAHLCLFFAVEALYTGHSDLNARLAPYAELVDRLAASPPIPPSISQRDVE
jgi:AcrR family transcriptional regulator